MGFSLATWNINSVRLRADLVVRFLTQEQVDVLCLQEIKCQTDDFPESVFRDLGYEHIAINGQKAYHGVAIVSRLPLSHIHVHDFCGTGEARHIAATVDGVEIHNLYVPAGGDVPDAQLNPKFAHKLAFVEEMGVWFANSASKTDMRILVGDLNIAPLENDVWNHKALLDIVSHTPIEVALLNRVQQAGDWCDAIRKFVPVEEKLYTWWSYRSPDWLAADKGRRLDHIWVSPSLAGRVDDMKILKETRSWPRPSDHAPAKIFIRL